MYCFFFLKFKLYEIKSTKNRTILTKFHTSRNLKMLSILTPIYFFELKQISRLVSIY